jgi:hypothetical protein
MKFCCELLPSFRGKERTPYNRKFDQKLKKRNFFCGRVLSIVPHPRERDSGTPEIEILGDSRARKLSCTGEFIAHMNKG